MPENPSPTRTSTATIAIRQASTPEQYEFARTLFQEYAAAIKIDLCFQGFSQELAVLERMYGPPDGYLLIASVDEKPAGCVALRKIDDGVGELKRMYVRPEFRGLGIGNALATTLLNKARDIGYRVIRLDTVASMTAARAIYAQMGFTPCNAYYSNPLPDVIYMEKVLDGSTM
jgi:putative acetyltransferase